MGLGDGHDLVRRLEGDTDNEALVVSTANNSSSIVEATGHDDGTGLDTSVLGLAVLRGKTLDTNTDVGLTDKGHDGTLAALADVVGQVADDTLTRGADGIEEGVELVIRRKVTVSLEGDLVVLDE
jgi:hypothetical protein